MLFLIRYKIDGNEPAIVRRILYGGRCDVVPKFCMKLVGVC
jgi:hypothetical protein